MRAPSASREAFLRRQSQAQERNARTVRIFAELPIFYGNLEPAERESRAQAALNPLVSHLSGAGAESVKITPTDHSGLKLNKMLLRVCAPIGADPAAFLARASIHTWKYFQSPEGEFVKLTLDSKTLAAMGVKGCCFYKTCKPRDGGPGCGAHERAFKARAAQRREANPSFAHQFAQQKREREEANARAISMTEQEARAILPLVAPWALRQGCRVLEPPRLRRGDARHCLRLCPPARGGQKVQVPS